MCMELVVVGYPEFRSNGRIERRDEFGVAFRCIAQESVFPYGEAVVPDQTGENTQAVVDTIECAAMVPVGDPAAVETGFGIRRRAQGSECEHYLDVVTTLGSYVLVEDQGGALAASVEERREYQISRFEVRKPAACTDAVRSLGKGGCLLMRRGCTKAEEDPEENVQAAFH